MINTQYITLDMKPSGVLPVLYCSQYDIGRPLGLVVYNSGEEVNLEDYIVTIEATRTDGVAITTAVLTDGNIGVFETTATMANRADTYRGKLVLSDGNGKRVASLAFVMCVTVAGMDENAESIEEDASLYQQYTATVQTLIAGIRADLAVVDAKANALNTSVTALDTRVTAHDGEIDNLQRYIIFPAMSPTFNPHGNCCAITYGTHAILFDLGLYLAFTEVRDALQSYGIDTIDAVFISHYHGDHDGNPYDASTYTVWSDAFDMSGCVFYLPLDPPSGITGWESTTEPKLRAAFPNNTFYKPPYGSVVINGITIEAINNTAEDYAYLNSQGVVDYNQYCQIFRAEYLGASALFLGDVGKPAEDYQYSLGHFKPTKIMTAPHHGLEGDANAGMLGVISPQYVYVSNGYPSQTILRDPLMIEASRRGAAVIENVSSYPQNVSGDFGDACNITGAVNTYSSYAGYGHRKIYFDPNASLADIQDGSEEHPYSSLRRCITQCKPGCYTEIIFKGDITEASGTVQITKENGFVYLNGAGHSAAGQPIVFAYGAHAIVNSLFSAALLQVLECSFVRLVACGNIGNLVVQESVLTGSSFTVSHFSWRNSICTINNEVHIGTGSI